MNGVGLQKLTLGEISSTLSSVEENDTVTSAAAAVMDAKAVRKKKNPDGVLVRISWCNFRSRKRGDVRNEKAKFKLGFMMRCRNCRIFIAMIYFWYAAVQYVDGMYNLQ